MTDESNTEFLRKHPFFRAILDAIIKRIETALVAAAILAYQHIHTHNQIWKETGDHFQDLVKQTQMLEVEVNGQIETNNIGK